VVEGLAEPLGPLITDHDPIAPIPVQKHLMTSRDQPPVHLNGQILAIVGMADENPRHHTPSRHTNR